ncbi:NADPH dehydrogenase, (Old yellow enzyme) involved in small alpha,beta-unsaturated carbonyl compound [Schizosaccharomyces osmophilus]|uniref:NADPH dehydrogenase, (Old yellow enzyme) involved in small alpha,beta-unsaturated carbonyl compound n=1 Tax=Schizosaccharomyces osmophilus TaxID=2545709 RepID=A0AAF0AX26_9SCHI|nr:NADPH dehydrogenase, (Old yellow enzyme) involved in small alpha,beta-unsaturated carbonyl compound [Schizosaccharomyces osmophilus]WBW73878.1 NADPH dehydrogenase, (Old yellow enzyme) involved in small alpha,beta-unsaturated carbonyl compound [Schizosaccharomyces osmophilus]
MLLRHRIVHAPMTRLRATDDGFVTKLMTEYYTQRSCIPGSLMISDATFAGEKSGGYPNNPRCFTEEHAKAWIPVTNAIHRNKSYLFMQLWPLPGEIKDEYREDPEKLKEIAYNDCPMDPLGLPAGVESFDTVQGINIYKKKYVSKTDIQEYIHDFVNAASLATHVAKADGVELHQANGFLLDRFVLGGLGDQCDPDYRGPLENRCRFALEVLEAVTQEIGQERVGYRISPYSAWALQTDTRETHIYLMKEISKRFPKLAYIHAIEPRQYWSGHKRIKSEVNTFYLQKYWKGPFITAGGYDPESAMEAADERGTLVAFGRQYIANPDLVYRVHNNLPLNPYKRSEFYTPKSTLGYIDYPFSQEYLTATKERQPNEGK